MKTFIQVNAPNTDPKEEKVDIFAVKFNMKLTYHERKMHCLCLGTRIPKFVNIKEENVVSQTIWSGK